MATDSRLRSESARTPREKLRLFDDRFEYGLLPSLTGFALRRASLLDFNRFGDAVGDRAITPLRYSLLEVVGANPGLSQVQLAEILGLSKPAATVTIDFWQGRSCLSREKGIHDRRSFGIFLTLSGEAELRRLQTRIAEHDKALTACLSQQELSQLHTLLQRISDRCSA